MTKKGIIHLSILAILTCATLIVWQEAESEKAEMLAAPAPEDEMEIMTGRREAEAEGHVMMKVILPMILTAAYAGFLTVVYVLPEVVDRFTQETLGSTEAVEDDALHDARAALAQGDYDEAIKRFREVYKTDPDDRFPLVEIARIQREKLDDPEAAVATLQDALESKDWRQNDAGFFMFRIADIYENDLENKEGAINILQQVYEEFPDTRHSANATHKLREFGVTV